MSNLLNKLTDINFYKKLPNSIAYHVKRLYHEKILFKLASRETVFTSIWKSNYWDNKESLSGPGSTLAETAALRAAIPELFEKYSINTLFDAPCGDLNWMSLVLKDAKFNYIGGDIVGEMVKINNQKFKSDRISFLKFDITTDPFPSVDAWLCRHVLFHLSNKDIYLALENFVHSDVRYIITTNCITDDKHVNIDIVTGDYRTLNLKMEPFNFPSKALWEIEDYVAPTPPMTIALWTREEIAEILPQIRKYLNL